MKVASALLVLVALMLCVEAPAQVIYEAPDPDFPMDGTDTTVDLENPFAFYTEHARRTNELPKLVGYPIAVVRDPRPYTRPTYRRPELFMFPRNLDQPEAASFKMSDLKEHRVVTVTNPAPKAPEMVWIGPDIKPVALNVPNPAGKGEIVIKPWKAVKKAPVGVAKGE